MSEKDATVQSVLAGRGVRVGLAVALYLVIALGITLPVVFSPTDHFIGHPQADVWKHLWNHDWTERALVEQHSLPTEALELNYPHGGSLYPVDLLNGILMIPLRAVFGHILAFNLLTWLHLVLGAISMFFLARRFTSSYAPALLAGFIYGFCPLVLTYGLASGVSNRLNLLWVPLFFLLFLRILEKGRIRDYLGAGVVYFLCAMGCWTYALLIYLLLFFFSLFLLLRPLVRRLKKKKPDEIGLKRRYVDLVGKKLVPVAVLCGLAGAPLYIVAMETSADPNALVERYSSGFLWSGDDLLTDARVPFRHAVLPFRSNLLEGRIKDKIYKSNYVGYGILFLAFFSLYSRRRFARFFFPASLFFLLISQGPYLSFTHPYGGVASPVYFFLVSVVPFMHKLNAIWQISLLTSFCLAIAVSAGLEVLLARWSGRKGRLLVLGGSLAVVVEMLFISPVLMPIPSSAVEVPSYYYTLAEDEDEYAVFDYPQLRALRSEDLDHSEYHYFQTIHHKAIPYGIERQQSWLNSDPFWVRLKRYQQGHYQELFIPPGMAEETTAFLIRSNFRYFIVHKRFIDPDRLPAHLALFEELFGPPGRVVDDLVVFELPRQGGGDE